MNIDGLESVFSFSKMSKISNFAVILHSMYSCIVSVVAHAAAHSQLLQVTTPCNVGITSDVDTVYFEECTS